MARIKFAFSMLEPLDTLLSAIPGTFEPSTLSNLSFIRQVEFKTNELGFISRDSACLQKKNF
jgi:hypothetical protein